MYESLSIGGAISHRWLRCIHISDRLWFDPRCLGNFEQLNFPRIGTKGRFARDLTDLDRLRVHSSHIGGI